MWVCRVFGEGGGGLRALCIFLACDLLGCKPLMALTATIKQLVVRAPYVVIRISGGKITSYSKAALALTLEASSCVHVLQERLLLSRPLMLTNWSDGCGARKQLTAPFKTLRTWDDKDGKDRQRDALSEP